VQVVKNLARADFLFYENFQLGIFGRAGESKVCGFLAGYSENRNLTGNEIGVRRGRKTGSAPEDEESVSASGSYQGDETFKPS